MKAAKLALQDVQAVSIGSGLGLASLATGQLAIWDPTVANCSIHLSVAGWFAKSRCNVDEPMMLHKIPAHTYEWGTVVPVC